MNFLAIDALASGALIPVLASHTIAPGQFSILWPSSRQLSPRLRVFVDFLCTHLFSARDESDELASGRVEH